MLRMSYNYSYVFVCIQLQINDSTQVIFVVLFTLYMKSLVKINYVPFMTTVLIPPLTYKKGCHYLMQHTIIPYGVLPVL